MTDTGDTVTGAAGSDAPINSQSNQALAEELNDGVQARLDAVTADMAARYAALEASVADRAAVDQNLALPTLGRGGLGHGPRASTTCRGHLRTLPTR